MFILVLGWLSHSDGLVSTRLTGGRPEGRFGLGAARHPLLCACQSLEGFGGAESQRQESSVSLRKMPLESVSLLPVLIVRFVVMAFTLSSDARLASFI